jgi:hypothetical protein
MSDVLLSMTNKLIHTLKKHKFIRMAEPGNEDRAFCPRSHGHALSRPPPRSYSLQLGCLIGSNVPHDQEHPLQGLPSGTRQTRSLLNLRATGKEVIGRMKAASRQSYGWRITSPKHSISPTESHCTCSFKTHLNSVDALTIRSPRDLTWSNSAFYEDDTACGKVHPAIKVQT